MSTKEGEPRVGLRGSQQIRRPRRFQIVMHNDDYTPAEWVTSVLKTIFRKSDPEALRLTMQIHHEGTAVVGVYTHEIAETKCAQTLMLARTEGHPFQISISPAEDLSNDP